MNKLSRQPGECEIAWVWYHTFVRINTRVIQLDFAPISREFPEIQNSVSSSLRIVRKRNRS